MAVEVRRFENVRLKTTQKQAKSMEIKLRSIIVAHDMTKKQREECKLLVNEAKEKNETESGDWVYKVWGPPGLMNIVRLRKRQ